MLQQIYVRNFAIIDQVAVDFGAGMNVLTGETGAGKSILIDALGLVLGARASADVVRAGESRAEISASFDIAPAGAAATWLEAQAFDSDGECHLRRVIGSDGRSRGYINGNPVPMQSLRDLGALLVTIHGQHDHQDLQRADQQRELLDARGKLGARRTAVAAAFQRWRELDDEMQALAQARAQRDERLAFLDFQLGELDALDYQDGEYAALAPERLRLANAEKLAANTGNAVAALYDDDTANAQALLARAHRELTAIAEFDPTLAPIIDAVTEAEVLVRDAAESLQSYQSDIDADPARQEHVEQRLATIESLARKHQVEADALGNVTRALRDERASLEQADETLQALDAERSKSRQALEAAADALTRARRKAAKQFAREVTAGMQTLGMPGGSFEVDVEPLADDAIFRHGRDRVAFRVSANPGQPPQALARVASGGELSRISLAIQVAAGRDDALASMVFDEVDSGVGGGVAEIVGQQMRALAAHCQVLAVTHLPQVAGQAHHHHKVLKMTDGKSTRTSVATRSDDARVEEVARMLGGVEITDLSRQHAREMIAQGR